MSENKTLSCPFCNEANFDAMGLKHHLTSGGCDIFEEVPVLKRRKQVTEQEGQMEFPKGTWKNVSYDKPGNKI